MSPKHPAFSEFIYIAATSDDSITHLAHLADGGAYPAVRSEVVAELTVVIPDRSILDKFHRAVSASFQLPDKLKRESLQLAQLRDTLLLKLLSGELTTPKAEQQLAEVEG